jgi:hypothetical protein
MKRNETRRLRQIKLNFNLCGFTNSKFLSKRFFLKTGSNVQRRGEGIKDHIIQELLFTRNVTNVLRISCNDRLLTKS